MRGKPVADFMGRLDDSLPSDILARVEIEDEAIRPFKMITRSPISGFARRTLRRTACRGSRARCHALGPGDRALVKCSRKTVVSASASIFAPYVSIEILPRESEDFDGFSTSLYCHELFHPIALNTGRATHLTGARPPSISNLSAAATQSRLRPKAVLYVLSPESEWISGCSGYRKLLIRLEIHMKSSVRTIGLGFAALAAMSAGGSLARADALYTTTNGLDANVVLAFHRAADGTLTPLGSFPTGGRGNELRLNNQSGLALSEDESWLYAINAASNEITVFAVGSDDPAPLRILWFGFVLPSSK
jgi:hypothetical protein